MTFPPEKFYFFDFSPRKILFFCPNFFFSSPSESFCRLEKYPFLASCKRHQADGSEQKYNFSPTFRAAERSTAKLH
jgi:hypothetical protein